MISYSHPDSLIETQWLTDHLNDPSVRIVEVESDKNRGKAGKLVQSLLKCAPSEF